MQPQEGPRGGPRVPQQGPNKAPREFQDGRKIDSDSHAHRNLFGASFLGPSWNHLGAHLGLPMAPSAIFGTPQGGSGAGSRRPQEPTKRSTLLIGPSCDGWWPQPQGGRRIQQRRLPPAEHNYRARQEQAISCSPTGGAFALGPIEAQTPPRRKTVRPEPPKLHYIRFP